jgi:hypothetical protein
VKLRLRRARKVGHEQRVETLNRRTPVFLLLRFLVKTVILGWVIKLLGRFFPILLRLARLWR